MSSVRDGGVGVTPCAETEGCDNLREDGPLSKLNPNQLPKPSFERVFDTLGKKMSSALGCLVGVVRVCHSSSGIMCAPMNDASVVSASM